MLVSTMVVTTVSIIDARGIHGDAQEGVVHGGDRRRLAHGFDLGLHELNVATDGVVADDRNMN